MNRLTSFYALLTVFLLTAGANVASASYPPAGTERAGRTDVTVSTDPRVQDWEWDRGLVVDSAGRVFVAYEVDDPTTGREVHVMRSTDDGATFTLWARRHTNDARELKSPALALVPGSPERIALAYEYDRGDIETFPYYQTDVNVAVARTDQSDPTWTVRTVFDSTGETILGTYRPDVTAVMGPNGPVVYVVANQALYPNTPDAVLFARSTDLGANWSTPFATKPGAWYADAHGARVAADDTGDVMVGWESENGADAGIQVRMASDFAANANDWDPSWTQIDGDSNGWFTSPVDVAAQRDGSGFVLVYGRVDAVQNAVERQTMVWSTDGTGEGWTGDVMHDRFLRMPRVEARHGQGWLLTGAPFETDGDQETWSVLESDTTTDPVFDRHVILADIWAAAPAFPPAMVAAHPAKDAYGMFWMDNPFDLSPIVRFDATWWSGPGAPSLVDDFPQTLPARPLTHPAVVDVTARSAGDEIVYGDADGLVHVVDHLGNDLPGWPQSVSALQKGQAIAVGDLDGDGDVEIVVPTAQGEVYVFEDDGTPRAGWPVDLGLRAVHVTVAPVSKITANDVVAVCGTQAFLLGPDGTSIPYDVWPVDLSDMAAHPASVGDLDLDGTLEVVVTTGDDVQVFDAKGHSVFTTSTGNDPFSAPAALGDLDRDGDLEIVAPTHGGFVYALHHDGSSVGGQWPVDVPGSGGVVGVGVVDVDGSADPEVLVTADAGVVLLLESDGTATPNWPVPNFGDVLAPAIADDIDGSTGEVLFATQSAWMKARHADGSEPFAWPTTTDDPVELSPATGDVDGDGDLDLIVLTTTSLIRFDLHNGVSVDDFLRWTQFGHDARRTHCTSSAAVVTSVGGDAGSREAVRIAFAPPSPNPARGGITHMRFSLPVGARARVEVFDVRGRRVRVLADGTRSAGEHTVMWDGRDQNGLDVSNGTYLGRLVVELPEGVQTLSRKVTVTQ